MPCRHYLCVVKHANQNRNGQIEFQKEMIHNINHHLQNLVSTQEHHRNIHHQSDLKEAVATDQRSHEHLQWWLEPLLLFAVGDQAVDEEKAPKEAKTGQAATDCSKGPSVHLESFLSSPPCAFSFVRTR